MGVYVYMCWCVWEGLWEVFGYYDKVKGEDVEW